MHGRSRRSAARRRAAAPSCGSASAPRRRRSADSFSRIDVRDHVVGAPERALRPGVGMQHALHAHRHQVLVLGEDRRRAVPVLCTRARAASSRRRRRRRGRSSPATASCRAGRPGGRGTARPRAASSAGHRPRAHFCAFIAPRMYSAQAFIWLRIGASEVPHVRARSRPRRPSRGRGRSGARSSPSRRLRRRGPGGISRNSPGRRR